MTNPKPENQQGPYFKLYGTDGCPSCDNGRITLFVKQDKCMECAPEQYRIPTTDVSVEYLNALRAENERLNEELRSDRAALIRQIKMVQDELLAAKDALKRECCCTGEPSWITGKPIPCDACDHVDRIEQFLNKKEGES